MKLTIQSMIALQLFNKAKLLAGKEAINNEISNIIVMEAGDIENWLAPGELLLTSFFFINDYTDQEIGQLIKRITEHEASGLIVKKGRYIDEIPNTVIEACEQYQLPLIEVDTTIKYSKVIAEITQILFYEEIKRLSRHSQIHHIFMDLAIKKTSINEIIEALHKLIECPIALTKNENIISQTDDVFSRLIHHEQLSQPEASTYLLKKEAIALDTINPEIPTHILYSFAIPATGYEDYQLKILHDFSVIDDTTLFTIETSINFMQLELIKKQSIQEANQNYKNDCIEDLLNGKISSSEKKQEVLDLLNLNEYASYRIINLKFTPEIGWSHDESKQFYQKLADNMHTLWRSGIYRSRTDSLTYIIKSETASSDEFRKMLTEQLGPILNNYQKEKIDYQISYSPLCKIDEFAVCNNQTTDISRIYSSVKGGSFIADYHDLGIYKLLLDAMQNNTLMDYIPDPLIVLENEHPHLFTTLETYLNNHLILKVSAKKLFIHPKTIRYRLNQIQEICDIDFDNAEEILQYNIGFRAYKILRNS